MYSNFYFHYCAFGGGADGIFGNAVLCTGVLYLFKFDVFAFGVSTFIDFDGVCGGKCAGALSWKSAESFIGIDARATNTIYLEIDSFDYRTSRDVGACNDATDYV